MNATLLFAALLMCFIAIPSYAETPPRGSIIIFNVPDAEQSVAEGINNLGVIVGHAHGVNTNGNPTEISFAHIQHLLTSINPPAGRQLNVNGINDKGAVVGSMYGVGIIEATGFLLREGVITEIAAPADGNTQPYAINNHGDVVGYYGHPEKGFLLSKGVFTPIIVPDSSFTIARGINDRGQIVGRFGDSEGNQHGFLWFKGIFKTIDYPGMPNTSLRDINNFGVMVGTYAPDIEVEHGFVLIGKNFTPIEIGALATKVSGINDWGVISGSFFDSFDTGEHAYQAHISQFSTSQQ